MAIVKAMVSGGIIDGTLRYWVTFPADAKREREFFDTREAAVEVADGFNQ